MPAATARSISSDGRAGAAPATGASATSGTGAASNPSDAKIAS